MNLIQRIILVLLLASGVTVAQTLPDVPWHAPGWSERVLVTVDHPSPSGGDVAHVRIDHCGSAAPGGNDYRVFDDAGAPLPYQVTFHDPRRYSLLSFRAAKTGAGSLYAVYYNKPDAPVDPLRAVVDDKPGASIPRPGPSAAGWIPRAGLVLTTLRRPAQTPNPTTIDEMAQLISTSPGPDGAGYRSNIADGFNPFGDSVHFISIYRGWIKLPQAGNYGFCTASNEASFSFLDGAELVHWPGRHTVERGKFGDKNAEHTFTAGLHYVEYYHEQVLGQTMVFLGVKAPGAGRYWSIPGDWFPQPHRASVLACQRAGPAPAPFFRAVVEDSVWPALRPDAQWTRVTFASSAGTAADLSQWKIQWTFGDGQSAAGAAVDHVFLRLGVYDIVMTAVGPQGRQVERRRPLNVYLIDHMEKSERSGDLNRYHPLVAKYDPAGLKTDQLAEGARLLDQVRQTDAAMLWAKTVIARPDVLPEDLADMHLLIAVASAPGKSAIAGVAGNQPAAREVIAHLQQAVAAQPDAIARVQTYARLIRGVGIDQADAEAGAALYAHAEAEARKAGLNRSMKNALREATIALGDVYLHARQLDKAGLNYATAEALAEPVLPTAVKASKSGAYAESIQQHIDQGHLEDAAELARRWQDEIPSDQIKGAVLFHVGKIEHLQGRPAGALRPLQLAISLGQGAEFEAEARWIHALSLRDLGRHDDYLLTLRGLVKSGLSGPFRDKALAAINDATAAQPASPLPTQPK